ncbi:hypothetical protein ACJJTC_004685 [Scirpophaga incertulas]
MYAALNQKLGSPNRAAPLYAQAPPALSDGGVTAPAVKGNRCDSRSNMGWDHFKNTNSYMRIPSLSSPEGKNTMARFVPLLRYEKYTHRTVVSRSIYLAAPGAEPEPANWQSANSPAWADMTSGRTGPQRAGKFGLQPFVYLYVANLQSGLEETH